MAKKTLADLKKCPIDFIYLWATDSFISKLGNKGKIIRQKKYYQYQTLWKAMADNEKFSSSADGQEIYNRWANEIAQVIKDTYGMTPGEILVQLAKGKTVFGKNWNKGVYGIGAANDPQSFSQNANVYVSPGTGKLLDGDMNELPDQIPIFGTDGTYSGYSCTYNGSQYQSVKKGSSFVAYSYSNVDGVVQYPNGQALDSSTGTFWQNANNYMPIINNILSWISSIVNNLFPNQTVLTTANTAPAQTEWVEDDDNTIWWIAGGLAVGGALLALLGGVFNRENKRNGKKK